MSDHRFASAACFLLISALLGSAAGQSRRIPAVPDSLIVARYLDDSGAEVEVIDIHSKPPQGYTAIAAALPADAIGLAGMPAYDWSFGCSPTAASMMAAYYDAHGYPNIYTGPANGGVMPLNNSTWGAVVINGETRKQCPLSATRNGVDGRATRGHVDDYWIRYGNTDPDPFIANSWSEHTLGDCLGDYMRTSQSTWNNMDGGTRFYYYPSGNPLSSSTVDDGAYGMRLFFESRGYTVTTCYTQTIQGYNGNTTGFTLTQFHQEIDAGYPVLLQMAGHTMIGFGYEDADSTIYLHDTWDYNDHSMKWGTYYSSTSMTQWGVVVLHLAPAAVQHIALAGGWNMISSYMQADNASVSALLAPLAGNLVIMKNGSGEVYWPSLGIDQIGSWNALQGYQLYLTTAATLDISGTVLDAASTPLGLAAGWNMISYVCSSPQSAVQALQSIQGSLVIAKNGEGMVYWPAYEINTIGSLQPGQGYQLYLSASATLTYPSASLGREASVPAAAVPGTEHFTMEASCSGPSAVLLWRDLPFADGDEIGVLTEGRLAGAGVVQGGQCLLTVRGVDPDFTDAAGAVDGGELVMRCWLHRRGQESPLEPAEISDGLTGRHLAGGVRYRTNSVLLLQGLRDGAAAVPLVYALTQNHPNPFNAGTRIEYLLPREEKVTVEVFNLAGERVRLLQRDLVPAGTRHLLWDGRSDAGRDLPSGLYVIRATLGKEVRSIKATLMR
ncbi:MAG TPA: FlgD immunoglobulin-like domain containing protein [bacterium]|nr:FlgD immunoglobulin-like domain containing protein [bacterium]HPR87081.1 FlgD immunoglobulin-like domain containing protein [bacterium]